MKLGLNAGFWASRAPAATTLKAIKEAERLGFDSVWTSEAYGSDVLSPLAWCLFAVIFLWTPVHFWALAILLKDEYARAGVPMLPVVRGERATVVQIAGYALLTVAISAAPAILHAANGLPAFGGLYLGAAVLLNALLLALSARLYRRPDRPGARVLFHYSMVYLALLFAAMAVDSLLS